MPRRLEARVQNKSDDRHQKNGAEQTCEGFVGEEESSDVVEELIEADESSVGTERRKGEGIAAGEVEEHCQPRPAYGNCEFNRDVFGCCLLSLPWSLGTREPSQSEE